MFILANLEKTIKTYTQKIIAYILLNNLTPFEIQVLSTSAIKCRSKFRIFQFASAMCQQKKKLPKTYQKPLHIMSAMASAYLGMLRRTVIFFNS